MTHEVVRDGLHGVLTGLVTPFEGAETAVDHDALAENARTMAERGIETVFACSNVSEYHSLSTEERIAVTETSVAALPDATTVLAGAGGSTADAAELARAAESAGADAVLVMPPHHTYLHEAGLLEYYRRIGDASGLPIVPYVRGVEPSAGFLGDLSRLESVAGIKYTIPDTALFADAVEAGAEDVVWINGLGERYAVPLYAAGARGMASGIGNVDPRFGLALYDALERGAYGRARELAAVAGPFMRFREEPGEGNTLAGGTSIQALKIAHEVVGLSGGAVREPLTALTGSERERARRQFETIERFVESELPD